MDIDVMPCESLEGYTNRLEAVDHGTLRIGLKHREESEKLELNGALWACTRW
jgi:hypothetical protein